VWRRFIRWVRFVAKGLGEPALGVNRGNCGREVRQRCFLDCDRHRPAYSDAMKLRLIALAFLCGSLLSLSAQVSVSVVLSQDKFLPAEELMAGVRVVNRSGQTLHLGADADWIRFTIEREGGGLVRQLSAPPVQRMFDLESTKQGTLKVDLAPCFDLRQLGRYRLYADVKIKDWNKVLTTAPQSFEIIDGTRLWEQAFGVPIENGSRPPEVRKYTLQQANYLKQLRLYLRISGSEGEVIKLINVGPMIAFGRPEAQVDKQSRLHLLYQDGAKTFSYLIVSPAGDIELRNVHEYADTRPRLQLDQNGEISVLGGARRKTSNDVDPVIETGTNDGISDKP